MDHTHPRPAGGLSQAAVDALLRDTTPWLSCEQCFEQMDVYAEAVASGTVAHDVALERHLSACPACREEAQSLIDLLRAD